MANTRKDSKPAMTCSLVALVAMLSKERVVKMMRRMVAKGVRVMADWRAAMRHTVQVVSTLIGAKPWTTLARVAATKKKGKMTPPGKPEADARTIATSFARATWTAPTCESGLRGSTMAWRTRGSWRPMRKSGVCWRSMAVCSVSSPHHSVCGYSTARTPTSTPTKVLSAIAAALDRRNHAGSAYSGLPQDSHDDVSASSSLLLL
mmetsp:Transcript_30043/g.91947  ORF Transcript_30043/g.91947 Transcript_30043/m.91947 type:complete len:205 (-) Transcript_30043:543-1157(-)